MGKNYLLVDRLLRAAVVAFLGLWSLSCGLSNEGRKSTSQRYPGSTRSILETWLVARDLPRVRMLLSEHFSLVKEFEDPKGWPEELRQLPSVERALRFPFSCPGFPSSCTVLENCISGPPGSKEGEPFELEAIAVTSKVAEKQPILLPFLGQTIKLVTFVLDGCNTGASLVLSENQQSGTKIVTIYFVVG